MSQLQYFKVEDIYTTTKNILANSKSCYKNNRQQHSQSKNKEKNVREIFKMI